MRKKKLEYRPVTWESEGPFGLRGIAQTGTEGWYTGRAGDGFVGDIPFVYMGLEVARIRAVNLNRMTALHGWHFIVVELVNWGDV